VLREEKGYTYGAYSNVNRLQGKGIWKASSSVRSNVTYESLETFKNVITDYKKDYSQKDLEVTKAALIKGNTRNFETIGSLIGILNTISTHGLPVDYLQRQQDQLQKLTLEEVKAMLEKYVNLDNMVYVVVGDKATQYDRLRVEGIGDPILVDKNGKPTSL